MTSIISTTSWTTAYGAAFITTDSDGTSDTEYLVLTSRPYAREDLEALWERARDAESNTVRRWKDAHPAPEPYYFSPAWTKPTWGQQRAHQAQLKALSLIHI